MGADILRYFWDSITSKAYWRYVFLSRAGVESIFAIFGGFYLILEILDFFNIFTKSDYGQYGFLIFLGIAVLAAIAIRRPIKSITVKFRERDFRVEVRITDIFEVSAAVMISSNTVFEADVAGGKISPDSLQGQFTAKYFTGNQSDLINNIQNELKGLTITAPYPMGTTIPVHTHGKTFYFTAMSTIGPGGNASSSLQDIRSALEGLWEYVRTSGELQKLAVPLVGTGRGRIQSSRKKMISLIAESFVNASKSHKFTDHLVIVVRPSDASRFRINLYDVKDHLTQVLKS